MQNKQGGFTLIELIMVIVILGILAATALPKFVNLGGDARASVIKALEGSMRSANSLVYAKAAAAGTQSASTGSLTLNGQTITLAYGFASTATELAKAVDMSPATDFTVAATAIGHAKAGTPATCQVAYTAATGVATPPTYTTTVTGCD